MFHPVEHTTTERTAAAVRAELARRKINGAELALALGWNRTTTWRRLAGKYPFDIEQLAAVADFLGVPLTDLLPERAA